MPIFFTEWQRFYIYVMQHYFWLSHGVITFPPYQGRGEWVGEGEVPSVPRHPDLELEADPLNHPIIALPIRNDNCGVIRT